MFFCRRWQIDLQSISNGKQEEERIKQKDEQTTFSTIVTIYTVNSISKRLVL